MRDARRANVVTLAWFAAAIGLSGCGDGPSPNHSSGPDSAPEEEVGDCLDENGHLTLCDDSDSTACADGEVRDSEHACRTTCRTIADCVVLPVRSYCALDRFCYGLDSRLGCPRTAGAPEISDSGPALFGAIQADLDGGTPICTKDPASCTNNGNVCAWTMSFYDAEGDFPSTRSELYGKATFIELDGTRTATFFVDAPDTDNSTVTLLGCYEEFETSVDGAFQIDDMAGNNSNAICVTGSAP